MCIVATTVGQECEAISLTTECTACRAAMNPAVRHEPPGNLAEQVQNESVDPLCKGSKVIGAIAKKQTRTQAH
jgi:hypothetical protein